MYIDTYGLDKEIKALYLDVFKMEARGSVRKPKEVSNVVNIRLYLDMFTLDVAKLDEFINQVYDLFPRGSITKMSSNIHFMRTLNKLEIVIELKIGDWY